MKIIKVQMKNNLKLSLARIVLAGISALYSNNSNSQDNQSQDFLKRNTIVYNHINKYKINLFETGTEGIIALDTNNNGINDQVIKKTINKKFLGGKNLVYEKWTDFNEDGIFDEYKLTRKDFNFFGKEKYFGTTFSEDTSEINKPYALPRFDGKKFDWKNDFSDKLK